MLVTTTPGTSTLTEAVRVFTWNDGPRRVFDIPVVSWTDPARWELRPKVSERLEPSAGEVCRVTRPAHAELRYAE